PRAAAVRPGRRSRLAAPGEPALARPRGAAASHPTGRGAAGLRLSHLPAPRGRGGGGGPGPAGAGATLSAVDPAREPGRPPRARRAARPLRPGRLDRRGERLARSPRRVGGRRVAAPAVRASVAPLPDGGGEAGWLTAGPTRLRCCSDTSWTSGGAPSSR